MVLDIQRKVTVVAFHTSVLLMLNTLVLSTYLDVQARLSVSDLRLPLDRPEDHIDSEIAPPSYDLKS